MNAKTVKKYSKVKYSNLHKTAVKYFNRFIRLRDTDENGIGYCISSGQMLRYGSPDTHAGHFYPATVRTLEFNEFNVHLQGKSDNYFGHGNLSEYQSNLVEKIGAEKIKELDFLAKFYKQNTFKQDRFTLIDIIEKYKAKCKELGETKNFEI